MRDGARHRPVAVPSTRDRGVPVLLLNDGQLIEEHIRRAGLSEDLVLQSIREHASRTHRT